MYRIRFDASGDYAESWCNLLLQRNQLGASTYLAADNPTCDADTAADGVLSVTYVPTTLPFPAEVLHAEIRVTLNV